LRQIKPSKVKKCSCTNSRFLLKWKRLFYLNKRNRGVTMTNKELTELIKEISDTVFRKPFVHEGSFNARLKTTGGRYLLRSHNIEINPKSYETFGFAELEGIIKHELCHYHLH